jgi:hypothetical protein
MTDGQSVSQSVCLDAEPILGFWPDIISRLKVSVGKLFFLSLLGPLSDGRSSLSFVSLSL